MMHLFGKIYPQSTISSCRIVLNVLSLVYQRKQEKTDGYMMYNHPFLLWVLVAGTGFNQKGKDELLKPIENIVFFLRLRS